MLCAYDSFLPEKLCVNPYIEVNKIEMQIKHLCLIILHTYFKVVPYNFTVAKDEMNFAHK